MDIEIIPPKHTPNETIKLLPHFFQMSNTVFHLSSEKNDNDDIVAKATLDTLNKDLNFNDDLNFLYLWHQSRYWALLTQYKKALKFYEKAFEVGKFRAGYLLKEIIREGITLAAYFESPQPFKKFYKWGVTYGLFSAPYEEVKEWILHDQAKQLFQIFNPNSCYKNVVGKAKEKYDKEGLNWLINLEQWKKRELDLRYLDRCIKGFGPTPLTQLMIFGALGQLEKVEKLLKAGADPKIEDDNCTTALMHCLIGDQRITALRLLDEDLGESINARSRKKRVTALQLAIDCGYFDLVQKIIEKGGNIEQKCSPDGEDGITPLYYTLSRINLALKGSQVFNHTTPEQFLKGIKIDDSAKRYGRALFDDELVNHHNNIVTELGEEQYSELKQAVVNSYREKLPVYYDVVDLLLKNGADVNAKHSNGFTPFLYSAETGDTDLFKQLLENGGNIQDRTPYNASVLHLASAFCNVELTRFILEHVDVTSFLNTPSGDYNYYPIHYVLFLFKKAPKEKYDMIHLILDRILLLKPDLNVKGNTGKTPLALAHELGDQEILHKLLDAGAGEKHSSGIILT